VANPIALSQNKRFINQDLNGSFEVKGKGYEVKRAKELLKIIPSNRIIVDLHTYSAISEPFVIIVDRKMIGLACKTGIKNIVIMEHNIKKGNALINHRDGISIEVGDHNDYESFLTTLNIINNLKKGTNYVN
jgi:hypothetical protein